MTRFGIRKKLKSFLGRDASGTTTPDTPARETFEVAFDCPDGSSYVATAKDGDSLVLTAGRGPQPISTACTDGTCGTCRVDVLAGADSLTIAGPHELKTKADVGVPDAQRLGCHTGVIGPGVRVHITNILGEELIDP